LSLLSSLLTDLPTASLTVDPDSTVFTGESVTLKCEITDYGGWRYQWYKGSSQITTSTDKKHTFIISSAADQDQYWCRGERDNRPTSSQNSTKVTLTVRAVLTIYPANQVFRGESVTLVCDIQGGGGSEWTYHWYNSGNTFYSYSTTEQCKLSSVSESDSGEYTCRGKVEGSTQYSDTSTAVKLTVSGESLPRATLTVDPGSTVFIRESVTLKCEITGYDGWRYQWFKGSSRTAVSQSQRNTFTFIGSAADQDQYWCRGLRYYTRPISSQDSNKITLTVRGEFTDLTLSMYNENYSGECMVKFKKINILFVQ
ncbi:Fc receptor-like protein 5, partial [Astyanax mexicanus]